MHFPRMNRRAPGFPALFFAVTCVAVSPRCRADVNAWFGIHIVDDATGRGVPLAELETVNHLRFVTDSAGWVAIQEPGWAEKPVYFNLRSHGYRFDKDGFGNVGVALEIRPGGRATVRLHRVNIAERLYRITGEGIYRDSLALGQPVPIREPMLNAQVAGQDSANAAVYGGRVYWFWGDTQRMKYPLGHFATAGAWADLPTKGGLDPAVGVDLHYWTNAEGFSRGMCPLDGTQAPYLVWIDGLIAVPDSSGRQRLVCHYSKMKTLDRRLQHGIAVWNDAGEVFEARTTVSEADGWRCLRGHPVRQSLDGREYVLCGDNVLDVRVPARLEDVTRPERYEAYSCLEFAGAPEREIPRRDASGKLEYDWQPNCRPVTGDDENAWLKAGRIKESEARVLPVDVVSGRRIHLHYGSTHWNSRMGRWLVIFVEKNGASPLGEVWIASSLNPTGPWLKARKILTHDRYSFYNPVQHEFFDSADGRFLYFEGTYANTFSGNPDATARYDYNQLMHRLDLDDPRLMALRQE